ncbi:hydrolase [Rhodococcus phage Finch]|uniref:Hydrolase n=1 Tax=Rhodococcus phage Finch TaxID=2094144 RepID=A0A2P1JXC6_9CAUD|nr:hydrolase [Rhodococcus phage Finch]AVO24970.1 hydrolase [Rhodococcus phage Finch]
MAVEQITAYTFAPKTRKLTLTGIATVDPAKLRSVRNKTRGTTYYLPGTDQKNILASGNVITLPYGYVNLADKPTDELVIMYGDAPEVPGKGISESRVEALIDNRLADTLDKVFARLDMRDPAPVVVAQASDSTGDSAAEWFELGAKEAFAAIWPERPAEVRRYDKATETLLAAAPWQAGTPIGEAAGSGTAFGRALFETPAANMIGTNPDVGSGPWVGALGTWVVAGGAARQTDGGILGVAGFPQAARTTIDGTYNCSISAVTTGATQAFTFFPVIAQGAIAGNRLSVELLGTTAITASLKLTSAGTNTTLASAASGAAGTLSATPLALDISITVNGLNVTATVGGATLNGVLTQAQRDTLTGNYLAVSVSKNPTLDIKSMEALGAGSSAVYLGTATAYNGCYAGGRLLHNIERLDAMYPVRPDVMFINHGHNYGSIDSTPEQFLAAVDAFVAALDAKYAGVPIVCLSQNPEFAGTMTTPAKVASHRARQMALRQRCKDKGWSYIPSFEAFSKLADGGAANVNADGVHPIAAGMRLQADVFKAWLASNSARP